MKLPSLTLSTSIPQAASRWAVASRATTVTRSAECSSAAARKAPTPPGPRTAIPGTVSSLTQ
jgi:hypothetical protein